MIIFFNKFILATVLHKFTDLEMHPTGSDYEYSFALKYTLGLFFTTAIMTYLVEGARFNNVYSEEFGVTAEESIMFFMNAFLVTIIWLINPWFIIHRLKRKYYFGRKDLTQKQANSIMEESKYSMGKRYA